MTTGTSTEPRVSIYDHRTVSIDDLPTDCTSWTPSGRVPIACRWAEINYDIPTGRARYVEVRGSMIDDRDIARSSMRRFHRRDDPRARRLIIRRRYGTHWRGHEWDPVIPPPWLLDLIDQYRPRSGYIDTGGTS